MKVVILHVSMLSSLPVVGCTHGGCTEIQHAGICDRWHLKLSAGNLKTLSGITFWEGHVIGVTKRRISGYCWMFDQTFL